MPVTPSRAGRFPSDLYLFSTTVTSTENGSYVSLVLRYTWNGLALFAIFVIARNTARSFLAWKRSRNADPTNTTGHSPPYRDNVTQPLRRKRVFPLGSSVPYQSQHHLFPPSAPRPFWMMPDHPGGTPAEGDLQPARGQGENPAPTVGEEQPDASPGPTTSGASATAREATLQRYVMMRPPPPPPRTPSAPSRGSFSPEQGPFGPPLIHHSNPDYFSSTAPSSPLPNDSPPEPPRQSTYARTLPPPSIPSPPFFESRASDSSGSQDGSRFSPRSYPSPTPFLPPAPPSGPPDDGAGKSVEVHGEVISVTDGFGAGWTRHTRVYGGGVCLACAASGSEGGSYGATALRPEGS